MPTEWIERQIGAQGGAAGRVLSGRHVLFGFVAFFLIVAASNAVMLAAAISTMPGLDARNGYEPSQAYNREIAAAQRQQRQAYAASVTLLPARDGVGARFTLADPGGQRIDGEATLRLEHPSDRRLDVEAKLARQQDGAFTGHLAGVPAGARNLVIEMRDAAGMRIYLDRQRVMIGGGS
jgi:nitrogen fixation protein FixH